MVFRVRLRLDSTPVDSAEFRELLVRQPTDNTCEPADLLTPEPADRLPGQLRHRRLVG